MEGALDRLYGRLFHERRPGAISAALDMPVNVRTITASRGRRQERQRLGTHASRWKDNVPRDDRPFDGAHVRPAEASGPDVNQAIPSTCATARADDASRIDEARVRIRGREMAEVGPTHRASASIGEPQGKPLERRWPRSTPQTCWRTPRRLRGENGAHGSYGAFNPEGARDSKARETWLIATRRKAS